MTWPSSTPACAVLRRPGVSGRCSPRTRSTNTSPTRTASASKACTSSQTKRSSPEDLQALDALLARHPAKLMLWEAPPLPETEELLRDRGIATVVFDPAAQPPSNGDFLTVMTGNAKRLACATGAEPCP